jgi:adenosylcobinamide-GDP ribazoletransferase
MQDFLNAITLLTILPVRLAPLPEGQAWNGGRALAYYPLVGLLIGGVLLGASFLLSRVFPPLVTAALTLVVWAVITGGLHLDGFTDACDALFVPVSRERRLQILRDVHLGAFGAAGLVLLLLCKAAALTSLTSLWPLLLAPVLGRWAIVYAATYPLARKEGMAALFHAGFTARQLVVATLITIVVALCAGVLGVLAFALAWAAAAGIARLAVNRLGGLTGDIYGSICESVEVVILLAGTLTLPVLTLFHF